MKRERRSFDNDFKRQIVESIVSGSATQAELAREHRISPVLINRWKKDYKAGRKAHPGKRDAKKDQGS